MRATTVGQLDPFSVAQAMEAKVRSLESDALASVLIAARGRLTPYYRGELVGVLRGESAGDDAGLDSKSFATAIAAETGAQALPSAVVTFLRSNLRVIDVIGGSFAAGIIRDAEDLEKPQSHAPLAVEDETEPHRVGHASQLAVLALAIVLTGALLSTAFHYAEGAFGRPAAVQSPVVRPVGVTAAAPRARKHVPFAQKISFSAKSAPFRQVIFSSSRKRRRL